MIGKTRRAPMGRLAMMLMIGASAPAMGQVFPPIIELGLLDGDYGLAFEGVQNGEAAGDAVTIAGDLNGDGYDDVVIAAPRGDLSDDVRNAGRVYVIMGRRSYGGRERVRVKWYVGRNAFSIDGVNAFDLAGISVAAAGDVNNDGLDDLIIGATGVDSLGRRDSGAAYVVFGDPEIANRERLDLATLDGTNGFVIHGAAAGDQTGLSVSSAGDVNGDGIDDLLVGAPEADAPGRTNCGRAYLIFGRSGLGSSGSMDLATLAAPAGVKIEGAAAGHLAGFATSWVVDINGDGSDDLAIGAPGAEGGAGRAYVVFGSSVLSSTSVINLGSLNGSNGFAIGTSESGAALGYALSGLSDINRDPHGELIIGAPQADPAGRVDAGAAYVILGRSGLGGSGFINVTALNGPNGFKIHGRATGDLLGHSVAAIGDLNGDRYRDMIIGAPRSDVNGTDSGMAFVIYGRPSYVNHAVIDLANAEPRVGFRLDGGSAGDEAGRSVGGGGDVNRDGVPSVLIGAPNARNEGGLAPGDAYFVFGGVETQLLLLEVDGPLVRRTDATFVCDGADPGERVYFLYSRTGPGNTYSTRLGISLDLAGPIDIVGRSTADANGMATLVRTITRRVETGPIWFQAAVRRSEPTSIKSNVVETEVVGN